jgi:hypothetical protein
VPREMHAVSRRGTGHDRETEVRAGEQPVVSSDKETLGCNLNCRDDYEKYKFSINQCESHVKSDLDRYL